MFRSCLKFPVRSFATETKQSLKRHSFSKPPASPAVVHSNQSLRRSKSLQTKDREKSGTARSNIQMLMQPSVLDLKLS
jgi:hypothetical protein